MVTFSLQDISDNRTFFEEIYRQRYGWTATELNDHDLLKWVNEHYRWIPFSSEYRKVVQIPIILNRTFLLENTHPTQIKNEPMNSSRKKPNINILDHIDLPGDIEKIIEQRKIRAQKIITTILIILWSLTIITLSIYIPFVYIQGINTLTLILTVSVASLLGIYYYTAKACTELLQSYK